MAEVERLLDADRRLALSYVAAAARRPLETLWLLDATLGAAIAGGSQPLTRQIRLAWWREALEDPGQSASRGEPLLERIAAELPPSGIGGAELARLAEGWERLVGDEPLTAVDRSAYAALRGGRLFALSARLLGGNHADAAMAGEGWALVDLARRSSDRAEAGAALADAAARLGRSRGRWPAPLRPLGMLVTLARRDVGRGLDHVERAGAPGRMLRMLRHRLAGE